VAVWGGGKVGLMARQSAYLLDTERVIAIDRLPERLQMVTQKVGAQTIDYTQVDSVINTLKEMTGGRGPSACIDAVGNGGARTGPCMPTIG
jgi:threonine dehydrogenase-like Zn-dependent dehydrogenase